MAILYTVDSPITREQRNNLNATFQDILRRFNKIAYDISVLSGGQEVDDLLNEIRDAINNANTAAQEVRTELADKIDEVDQKIADLNAIESELLDLLNEINIFVNSLVHRGNYSATVQYQKNNEVLFFGSTYRAKRDNIGVEPPQALGESNDDWQLIARRGTDAATENIRLWRGPLPPTDTTMLWFEDHSLATGQEILIFGGVAPPVDPLSLWLREGGI